MFHSLCADVLSLICPCLSGYLCTHLLSLVRAMKSILLGFVLSQIIKCLLVVSERNTPLFVVFVAFLVKSVYRMYVICRRILLLNPACYLG